MVILMNQAPFTFLQVILFNFKIIIQAKDFTYLLDQLNLKVLHIII